MFNINTKKKRIVCFLRNSLLLPIKFNYISISCIYWLSLCFKVLKQWRLKKTNYIYKNQPLWFSIGNLFPRYQQQILPFTKYNKSQDITLHLFLSLFKNDCDFVGLHYSIYIWLFKVINKTHNQSRSDSQLVIKKYLQLRFAQFEWKVCIKTIFTANHPFQLFE